MDSLSKLPSTPFIGLKVEYTCIDCLQTRFSTIVDHNEPDLTDPNEDGSFIYLVKIKCQKCGCINGEHVPVFYNLYARGVMS